MGTVGLRAQRHIRNLQVRVGLSGGRRSGPHVATVRGMTVSVGVRVRTGWPPQEGPCRRTRRCLKGLRIVRRVPKSSGEIDDVASPSVQSPGSRSAQGKDGWIHRSHYVSSALILSCCNLIVQAV